LLRLRLQQCGVKPVGTAGVEYAANYEWGNGGMRKTLGQDLQKCIQLHTVYYFNSETFDGYIL